MRYSNIKKGLFIKRHSRFTASVLIDGNTETVHVKNTGRLRELLTEGAEVYLEKSSNPERKTKYDLISAVKDGKIVNIDSIAPNHVFGEWVRNMYPEALIKREYTYGDSRFDYYYEQGEKKYLTEVKGVTLLKGNTAFFPDAPTERGVKHLNGLIEARRNGFETMVFFVVRLENAERFSPNSETQPEFGIVLKKAVESGVKIRAFRCKMTEDEITYSREIPVIL